MRPKKREGTGLGDLFRASLDHIINMKYELFGWPMSCRWPGSSRRWRRSTATMAAPGSRPDS